MSKKKTEKETETPEAKLAWRCDAKTKRQKIEKEKTTARRQICGCLFAHCLPVMYDLSIIIDVCLL